MWGYRIALFTRTHCVARGLRPLNIAAYETSLKQFRFFIESRNRHQTPDRVTVAQVLEYLQHLRSVRNNGESAVNRQLTILRSFYRAMVAMGHLDARANPLAGFPSIKAVPRKLPTVLTAEEAEKLLAQPRADTVLGVRDRALMALLYGTGIRASECAGLRQRDVDLDALTVTVIGKGGHQRTIPFNENVGEALRRYAQVRGAALPAAPFFVSRRGRAISRGALYERVRSCARRARIAKVVSPHRLRHTFASHLVRAGVGLVTIRDLLGHRLITSTQIYLHVTAQDLRGAIERHPIARLMGTIEHLVPNVRLPFQHAPPIRSSR